MMPRLNVGTLGRVTTLAILAVACVPGCTQAQSAAARDTAFAVARNGVIDITMRSGRLIVRGGERATAELRSNGHDYQLRDGGVGITIGVGAEFGRSGGRRSSSASRSNSGDVELLVPRFVKLVVNGMSTDVGISDVAGDVEVQLLTGDVELRALGGRAIVSSVSGDVRVTEGVGDLRVSTVGGDIEARQVRGNIDVNTTSGDVTLSTERARRVAVNTVSGTIVLDGALADDARLQFTTHSGDVVLRLPASAAGQLEVSTYNGSVSGGTLTLLPDGGDRGGQRDRQPNRYQFGGGGGARITVSTFSGDITLSRGARRGSE